MEDKFFLIVWNQENVYGYHTLPRDTGVLKIYARSEEEAVEQATVKIMNLVNRQLGDVSCRTNRTSSGLEILVHSEDEKTFKARIFDIHPYMTA